MKKFKNLGLSEKTLTALKNKGFVTPSEIQEKCIPLLLGENKDIVGQAQTGTGKTAAFGLPIIEKIDLNQNHIQALIVTPTRELANQVAQEMKSFYNGKNLQIVAVYGGQPIGIQIKQLNQKPPIIVGTPGRLLDLIEKKKKLDLSKLDFLILDEADEMLAMGFVEDIEKIIEHTPEKKKMLLFSATMPQKILNLAKKYMPKYEHIKIDAKQMDSDLIDQIYFETNVHDKFEVLSRIIDMENEFYGVIFCKTKIDVDNVVIRLINKGYKADGIHGDIVQAQREKIFNNFKQKKLNILVATDVAARGLDVNDLTHVINYTIPNDPEIYTHRIGRTGRAGKKGKSVTLVTPGDRRKFSFIQSKIKSNIKKEDIPKINDIIKVKENKIKTDIQEIIDSGDYKKFNKFSKDIIKDNQAEDVLSALIKYSFEKNLDEKNYKEIKKVIYKNNTNLRTKQYFTKKNESRLFVARGKKNGLSPKSLADFIAKKSKVKNIKFIDIFLKDDFSFITVPERDAKIILKAFKGRNGGKSIVSQAKN